ncbi:MAG: SPOR domain-containing protein [Bacteroidota bacterium]|nr:SPOR domain-containing protein [Bacteroidota bacterium]
MRYVYAFLLTVLLLPAAMPAVLRAQAGRDIEALLHRVRAGEREEVARLLPSLRKTHADKAGVLFLEAICEENAEKALDIYQRIVDEHAGSSWADDALHRLYQYSYAVGAYRTARTYQERMDREFPRSPYASAAAAAASAEADGEKQYSVQVGAYSKEKDARRRIEELKAKGYTAYLREKTVRGKTVYAVWLGIFPAYGQAQNFARKLKEQQGLDALVVRR